MAKTKVLERKPLSFAEKTFIPQIVTGLKTTLSTMFDKTVTLQYPEERPVIPDNYRGVPTLVKDPHGKNKIKRQTINKKKKI
jgi:NADH-quinone oxidoreductase subunit I